MNERKSCEFGVNGAQGYTVKCQPGKLENRGWKYEVKENKNTEKKKN